MKPRNAVEAAKKSVPKNDDGGYDEKALIDEVTPLIDFDADQERWNKAKKAVDALKKPGSTESDGVTCLPGLDAYAWEPQRLIADDQGHLIEQAKARPHYKDAEAKRAREVAKRQAVWADRKTTESTEFAAWAIRELARGRKATEILFDTFLRESGYWSSGEAPPEQDAELPDAA